MKKYGVINFYYNRGTGYCPYAGHSQCMPTNLCYMVQAVLVDFLSNFRVAETYSLPVFAGCIIGYLDEVICWPCKIKILWPKG